MKITNSIAFALLTLCVNLEPLNAENKKPDDERLAWWRDARFGMFIHWGPVSLKGTEIGWSRGAQVPIEEYDNLCKQFNPAKFNADEWVAVAKTAGMKYMVLTTKHHDGFCLWETKQTDYNIMNTPFRRDVVKELAAACKQQGIVFCAYHSICDWHHPDYPLGSPGGKTAKLKPDMDRYNAYLKNQLAELIQNYGPLGILWFDGEWEKPWTIERGTDLYDYLRKLQPSLIINNRVSKARAGMAGTSTAGQFAGDYDTPEQRVGKLQTDRPWETCMTICHQWAWKPDDTMKSLKECLQTLVRCAGGDGNLLFNVGPMPTGEIEPRQVERLKEMGQWLGKHGETIYGTRGGPWLPTKRSAATCKGSVVYAHIFNWDGDEATLPGIERKIVSHAVLTGGNAQVTQTSETVTISVPAADRQEIDTIVALTLDGPAFTGKPLKLPTTSVAKGKKATASNVFHNQPTHGAAKAFDDNEHTRWATDAGTHSAWLEVDLCKPVTIDRARICEACGQRVEQFELQAKDGDTWRTFAKGRRISDELELSFRPVTAQVIRLNILKASEGPTIWEFELFEARK